MKIEIYSLEKCPFCIRAKEAMHQAGYTYINYTVGKGGNATKEDIQHRVNALGLNQVTISTVPQIFIDDEYIGGYDNLVKRYDWAKNYSDNKKAQK